MTFTREMNEFIEKYEIPESGKDEMLELFNKSIIQISHQILKNANVVLESAIGCTVGVGVNKLSNSSDVTKKIDGKKFASKKAEEFAIENNLSLDEFEMEKVSKKDVEIKIKEMTKKNINTPDRDKKKSKGNSSEKDKVMCAGITKKGDACNRIGNQKPEGAKKYYCFRHSDSWQDYECNSDSSDLGEVEDLQAIDDEELKCEPCKKSPVREVKSPTKLVDIGEVDNSDSD